MSAAVKKKNRLRPPSLEDGAALWGLRAMTRPPFRLFKVLGTGLLTGLRQPVPPSPMVSGRDYANRLQAFQGFAMGSARGGAKPASTSYIDVWREEGRGYRIGADNLAAATPRRLETLPQHTGAGLAVAQAAVKQRPGVASCVESVRATCGSMAEAGHEPAMLEALGLAVQLFAPGALADFDAHLRVEDPELRPLLWHGAGRGLYFSPWSLILGGSSDWRCIEDAQALAPHDLALDNLLAGLSWAVTLVNLRSPHVVVAFVRAMGRRLPRPGPLTDGMRSALWLWRHWDPESDLEQGIARELSAPGPRQSAWERTVEQELWNEDEVVPADAAPGSIFGYHARS